VATVSEASDNTEHLLLIIGSEAISVRVTIAPMERPFSFHVTSLSEEISVRDMRLEGLTTPSFISDKRSVLPATTIEPGSFFNAELASVIVAGL